MMRIAHISDLHLRHHLDGTASIPERRSRDMPDYLATALRQVAQLGPDVLVLTGDLIDYPLDQMRHPEMIAKGRQDLQLIAELVAEVQVPVLLTYGNHDHPQLFHETFSHSPHDLTLRDFHLTVFFDAEGPHHIPQRIDSQRTRFLHSLRQTASLRQIHIQHYVVWPPRNQSYPHTYGEAAWMRDQIQESNRVQLVLSGHYHIGIPLFQDHGTWYSTARAFCEAPHPFFVYDLVADGVCCQQHTIQ